MTEISKIKEKYIEGNENKYEVIEILAQTKNAIIYKAKIKNSNDEFRAIKVYDKARIIQELKKRLLRTPKKEDIDNCFKIIYNEIKNMKIVGNNNNNNTVRLYESFENDYKLYIVMELCDENFESFISSRRAFNSNKIYEILNHLNKSFQIMSETKLIHKAINLGNILIKYLDRDKKKYIVKLQLTEDSILNSSNKKKATRLYGDPKYFAPEILKAEDYNEKCDLWSLGVVIYKLYFNEIPFEGRTQKEILNNINNNMNIILNKIKKGSDSLLNDLIIKLLNPDISERYDWNQYFNHSFFRKKENCRKFYDLINEIGHTDYATIYEAISKETNESRGIKIYNKTRIRNEDMKSFMDGIYKEMEIMKIMQGQNGENKNSVQFYEFFDNDEEFASVMELCDDNLSNIFINSSSFTSEQIIDLLNQLNNSFQIIVENKLILRALNLENILIKYIDEEKSKYIYKLKVTNDSDWLKNLLNNNNFASINGLINFIPPEILNGRKCSLNCDLWSLGIIIYALYFHEYPYNGEMEEELLNDIKYIKKNFKTASDSNIDDLIRQLLTYDPKERITWEKYFNHPLFKGIQKSPKKDYRKFYEIIDTIGYTEYATVCIVKTKANNEIRAIKIYDLNKIKLMLKPKINRIPEEKDLRPYINKIYSEINHMKIIEGKNKDNKYAVKFFENFENEKELSFVMELGDENLLTNLGCRKNRNESFSSSEIGRILSQLNNSFKIMIENNIIHRALNLENILVKYLDKDRKKFIVKLLMIDDTISKDDLNNENSFYNPSQNKNFLAPEILEHKKNYNEKCDLWSLGIIIYDLYFKEFPYKGEKEEEILKNIHNIGQNLQKISDHNLDDLMRNLLKVDVEERFGWKQYFEHPFFSNHKTMVY